MMKAWRSVGLSAALLLCAVPGAWAQKTTSNPYNYWVVCGGNSFATCAAVDIEITAVNNGVSSIEMRVWNLSGLSQSAYAGTVFTGIGFYNTGAVTPVWGSLAMTGGSNNKGTPAQWQMQQNTQIGGGINLQLVTTTPNGVRDGIASDCAPASLLPAGSKTSLWKNPCETDAQNWNQLDWDDDGSGWVVFTFQFTGNWNFATTELLVKGQNGPNGQSTECITGTNCGDIQIQCRPGQCETVPEPITTLLLGTGLLGVGAARRRRRNRAEA